MIFLYHKIAMEKYSRQRELIYHSLETRKDHPTAEELYLDLKEKMPEIGIATVYRNLSDLCQKGKIIKIKSKYGPDRFDGNFMPHIHFQCEQCNNIVDIELKSEEKEKRIGVIYVGENEKIFDQLYIEDEYGILYFWLKIDGLTVAIENELLYRSLLLLPHKRLVILILSFFEGMTDKEISQEMLLPQSTVQYNRITALKRIRKLMEGMKDEP